MKVDAGGEDVGVVREAHCGEEAAVTAAPEADAGRIDVGTRLQKFSGGDYVAEFGGAAACGAGGFGESAAVADAAAIVDGKDDVAAAGEVRIHGVRVRVVVHVVPAEKHLTHGATVVEDESRMLFAGLGVAWHKQLAVNFEAVGGVEDHLLRGDKLVGGKVGKRRSNRSSEAIGCKDRVKYLYRMGRVRTHINKVVAVGKNEGAPLDALRTQMRHRTRSAFSYVDQPYVAAVDVGAVGIEGNFFPVRREGPLLDFAFTGGQQLRCAAVCGERIEMLPAVFFARDHQMVVRGPIEDATAGVLGHVGE